MGHVAKPLVSLAALALAGVLVYTLILPRVRERPTPLPPPTTDTRLPEAERRRLLDAPEAEAPGLLRESLRRATTPEARDEITAILAARAEQAAATLAAECGELRTVHRYEDAARLVERYRLAWHGSTLPARADEILAELRDEQAAQVSRRRDEARALVDEHRFDGAREALQTGWQFESAYREALAQAAEDIERLIRIREHELTRGPAPGTGPAQPTVPSAPGEPPGVPALPGAPSPDVKRLGEARALLADARRLYADRRYQPAAKALADVTGFYGDLRYVARRQEGIAALLALSRHATAGIAGLFHAAEVKRDRSRLRLRYAFKDTEELLDWEEFQPVPHAKGGSFRVVTDGVRGDGLIAYLLKGFFENDVTIRCLARPRELKSHGLIFCQDGLETRFLLWMVSNHFFVEGENYVKERPGHSILMFGKGVNADVPVDSPEIGFIFRGATITKPELVAGEEEALAFAVRDREMAGEVIFRGTRGGRSGECVGDDGRGIERVRPGLVVLENGVTFRDVVIEGRVHPDFERARVAALLDLATTIEDD